MMTKSYAHFNVTYTTAHTMSAPVTDMDRRRAISVREIGDMEDVTTIKKTFNRHLHYTVIKDRHVATQR